jgi:RNA polymerase sigma-70 factor (ECF subfamily)
MAEPPVTRASLLLRIRNSRDSEAWSQFVEVYAPLIYGYARRHGLQDADAADLVQDVLRTVSSAVKKLNYEAEVGTFRGWLFTVARTKLSDLVSRRQSPGRGTGESAMQQFLQNQPVATAEEEWNTDYERRLFAWAAERVRGEVQDMTWQAFWQTTVEGKSGKEVSSVLGMTVAAVYLAKSRVMLRLKDQLRILQED